MSVLCTVAPPLGLWLVYLAVLFISHVHEVCPESQLTMLSEGDVYVLDPGEAVHLDCEFKAKRYNLFDYPVLWKKDQLTEEGQINIMGNINTPYVESDRFEVKYSPLPPRYRLELSINGVETVDSGNYTCEIRGPQSVLLGAVTHSVYVRAPVRSMSVTSDNGTTKAVQEHHVTDYRPGTLTVSERDPTSVICVVTGGYPPPNVQVYLGQKDISDKFHFIHRPSLQGDHGLRNIVYHSERWTHTFVARADDDGKSLKCIATVPGLKSNISLVTISVHYAPRIQCYRAGAYLGDENVQIRCEIRAKPVLTSTAWIIEDTGTTLAEGEVINGFWTKSETRIDGVLETTLFLAKAKLNSFRTFTLVAENDVALTKEEVELFRKYKSSSTQPLSRGKEGRQSREGQTGYKITDGGNHFSQSVLILALCQTVYLFMTHCYLSGNTASV